MKNFRHARSFKDLLVYQKAIDVAGSIFKISKNFPNEETYALSAQIRRSSRAIGAHIAEAWGKRRYEKHFISKLTDADAKQMETQHWLDVDESCGYLDGEQEGKLKNKLEEIGRMINGMMSKAHLFCGQDTFIVQEEMEIFQIEDH